MIDTLKEGAKWVLRPVERARIRREARVKQLQDELLPKLYPKGARKLIVFFLDSVDLVTGKEKVSGGLLSIHSIFEETLKLEPVHGAATLLCSVKDAYLFFGFSTFQSPHRVFRYRQLETYFREAQEVIAHVPEYMVEYFVSQLEKGKLNYLTSRKLHVNILNQNIQLMPPVETIRRLQAFATKTTQTTAHERYAVRQNRDLYGIPLHHFSTFIAPERYTFRQYAEKRNRIAFSPDNPEKNAVVIEVIRRELPDFEVVVIGGMTYEQFKEFIAATKFTFTFGEGLDGYYCETVLTGGISFAVYNEDFFTADFGRLDTVHASFETLVRNCVGQIRTMNDEIRFTEYNRKQFDLLTDHYKFSRYQDNIRKFYLGEYTLR